MHAKHNVHMSVCACVGMNVCMQCMHVRTDDMPEGGCISSLTTPLTHQPLLLPAHSPFMKPFHRDSCRRAVHLPLAVIHRAIASLPEHGGGEFPGNYMALLQCQPTYFRAGVLFGFKRAAVRWGICQGSAEAGTKRSTEYRRL